MFEAPVDSLYVMVGLSLVSVAVAGTAVGLPTTPAPNAASLADTVDSVAASPYPATAEHPTDATAVRIGPRRVALRNDGGVAHATFTQGPVVPVDDGPLERVLRGVPPDQAFESPDEFRQAMRSARTRSPSWRHVDGEVWIRNVVWGDVRVTLVG